MHQKPGYTKISVIDSVTKTQSMKSLVRGSLLMIKVGDRVWVQGLAESIIILNIGFSPLS
jgi:hypothetical protein